MIFSDDQQPLLLIQHSILRIIYHSNDWNVIFHPANKLTSICRARDTHTHSWSGSISFTFNDYNRGQATYCLFVMEKASLNATTYKFSASLLFRSFSFWLCTMLWCKSFQFLIEFIRTSFWFTIFFLILFFAFLFLLENWWKMAVCVEMRKNSDANHILLVYLNQYTSLNMDSRKLTASDGHSK